MFIVIQCRFTLHGYKQVAFHYPKNIEVSNTNQYLGQRLLLEFMD